MKTLHVISTKTGKPITRMLHEAAVAYVASRAPDVAPDLEPHDVPPGTPRTPGVPSTPGQRLAPGPSVAIT